MNMKIEWNKVTWYSKLAAVIVFVGTFVLAFWLGTVSQQTKVSSGTNIPESLVAVEESDSEAQSTLEEKNFRGYTDTGSSELYDISVEENSGDVIFRAKENGEEQTFSFFENPMWLSILIINEKAFIQSKRNYVIVDLQNDLEITRQIFPFVEEETGYGFAHASEFYPFDVPEPYVLLNITNSSGDLSEEAILNYKSGEVVFSDIELFDSSLPFSYYEQNEIAGFLPDDEVLMIYHHDYDPVSGVYASSKIIKLDLVTGERTDLADSSTGLSNASHRALLENYLEKSSLH